MELEVDRFREVCEDIFLSHGFDKREAETTADEIVDAEMRGIKSHGASIVPEIVGWGETESGDIEVEREESACAFIRGNGSIGPVVAEKAMDMAIEKAGQNGIGVVGVNNEYPFITAGYNPRRAAEEGFIGINWSAASSKVALYGSSEGIIGTNPIGIGVPADEFPLVLDMAVTETAAADIRRAKKLGEQIPGGVAIDDEGDVTRDPGEAIEGAMLPFGGYKGSGLGVMIELLGGAWVGGKTGRDIDGNRGMVFMAMKPGLFISKDDFMERVSSFVSEVKQSDTRPGFDQVLLPGEKEHLKFQEAKNSGEVEIKDGVYQQLEQLLD